MSDLGQTRGWDDAHALSGAYAVDALDAVESARFESHLVSCPTCRDEVDELRATAAVLGVDAELAPPPALRAEVLASIAAIRPLPPLTTTSRDDEDDHPASPISRTVASLDAARQRRRLRRPLMMVAAAMVLFFGIGAAVSRPWADDQGPARLTAAERVMQAPDAVRLVRTFEDGAKATVYVSRSQGKAVIVTDGMAPAPSGHDYEVWFASSTGDMARAGLMPDLRDSTLVLDGDAASASAIGITIEPEGGSESPTTDPIAYFNLEA